MDDFEQRIGTGRTISRKALVKTFPRESGVAGQLSHASGPGNVTQRRRQQRRIAIFYCDLKIGGDICLIVEVVGYIKRTGLDPAHFATPEPKPWLVQYLSSGWTYGHRQAS